MTPSSFILVLLSVTLSAVAQLLLKLGVARAGQASASAAGPVAAILSSLASPWVLGGLALYGLGALIWLLVLARLPLSLAYPFVGMGFILTMLIGASVLGETLSVGRIAGTLLIALGCVLVARSA